MQGLFADLLFLFFPFLVSPHIVFLDLFDKLNFRIISVQDEFLVVSLRVEYTVNVFEGDLKVLVFY